MANRRPYRLSICRSIPKSAVTYNVDAERIDDQGRLLQPEKRWGGIMRRLDNTNFEQSNIEYVQFWLMNPFLDPENPNTEGATCISISERYPRIYSRMG